MPMHILTALLPFSSQFPRPPLSTRLIGSRLVLRAAEPSDWAAWRDLRILSRDFLVPWEPVWPSDCLTYSYFLRMRRRQDREWRQGRGYAFFVFLKKDSPPLVGEEYIFTGAIMLNDVRRGIAQKATLGYWVGQPYARQGFMTEASQLISDFAFNELKLNRLEASCLPRNEPSTKLLRRVGFEEEGYAKAYLRVNGKWEDHILWGRSAK